MLTVKTKVMMASMGFRGCGTSTGGGVAGGVGGPPPAVTEGDTDEGGGVAGVSAGLIGSMGSISCYNRSLVPYEISVIEKNLSNIFAITIA